MCWRRVAGAGPSAGASTKAKAVSDSPGNTSSPRITPRSSSCMDRAVGETVENARSCRWRSRRFGAASPEAEAPPRRAPGSTAGSGAGIRNASACIRTVSNPASGLRPIIVAIVHQGGGHREVPGSTPRRAVRSAGNRVVGGTVRRKLRGRRVPGPLGGGRAAATPEGRRPGHARARLLGALAAASSSEIGDSAPEAGSRKP